jgi:Domain of unknown function (DUF4129)
MANSASAAVSNIARWHAVAVALLAAIGLALALAAARMPPEPTALGNVAKKFIIDLPEWLTVVVLAALGAAASLLLALIVPRPRRRRKRDDDVLEQYHEPLKMTVGDYVFVWLLALVPFALSGAMFWFAYTHIWGRPVVSMTSSIAPPTPQIVPAPPPSFQQPEHLVVHSVTASAILGTLAILTAVAALGLMLWLYFGDRILQPQGPPRRGVSATLGTAIDDSLDDLRFMRDPREAIIKCYARFERALASVEFPRAPWQTPVEFMRAILQRRHLPHDAVSQLTGLFEIARFSRHALHAAERDAAWRSLVAIKSALERREVADASPS